MSVADICEYIHSNHLRQTHEKPVFKWYIIGLSASRIRFVEGIEGHSNSETDQLCYGLRDVLKSMNFVALWDRVWLQARITQGHFGVEHAQTGLHFAVYNWVLDSIEVDLDPSWSANKRKYVHLALARLRACNLNNTLPGHFRAKDCPPRVPFEEIDTSQAFHMECHWGRQFYGSDLSPGFSTVTSEVDDFLDAQDNLNGIIPSEIQNDINAGAAVEAYDPEIEPIEFAYAVVGEERPTSQNCAICAEDYGHPREYDLCLKLRACGHYFHYACVYDWINGVATNSNRCPECRAEICKQRRDLRVVGTNHATSGPTEHPSVSSSTETGSDETTQAGDASSAVSDGQAHAAVVAVVVVQASQEARDAPSIDELSTPGEDDSQTVGNGTSDERSDEDQVVEAFATLNIIGERDENNSGWETFNADDIETFQTAGLTERPTSPIYVPGDLSPPMQRLQFEFPRLYFGGAPVTYRSYEPESEFEYDMDRSETEEEGKEGEEDAWWRRDDIWPGGEDM
ncbi:hypothetical protein EK21DRAFT_114967 [Setomelanomma holmii]|uniref:RING-type domain-containing protein n=1 Tax=Setomelanomma holmii TaxID=210430 RepID=A0A9P4H3I5_9PLEO|nr:hypothetical protein EK21DRAFT_114967 [Setomelanomma holmii]